MSRKMVCVLATSFLSFAGSAFAQINDGFESYAPGTLPPQGGWIDFGGTQPVTVSTTQAHSGTKSMRLSEGTDAVSPGYGSDVYKNFLPAGGYTSGTVTFSFWQFIEPTVDSEIFMYISNGRMPATFETGLDLRADAANADTFGSSMLVVQDETGGPTLQAAPVPLVKGRWVQHSMTVNLTTDRYNYSYDGVQLVTGAEWDKNPTPGTTGSTIGGIDFWMQRGNADGVNAFVYYDDFLTVVPEPTTALASVLGLTLVRRRRA